VQDACKPGDAARPVAAECESNLDCCSGAICSLDVANAPKKHCVPLTACVNVGGTCSLDSDCCGGRFCSAGKCADPPPLPTYGSATYVRDYQGDCNIGKGEHPYWRLLEYQAVVPAGTSIEFSAASADTQPLLSTATPVVMIGTATPPSTTGWTGFNNNIDQLLKGSGGSSSYWMRLNIKLNASSDNLRRPTLTNWRVSFSCTPSE
jgi:hypothetical protein